ncbi:carboxylating nicotinate-nucleotide diphosphorylase [Paraglaciecola psychrophila]|uniref:Probable nicotinate-nucleotide pyrophosphorylase [carboxylating] n=1 Tax=Paraglaciecola psychrophila 170 TaxID=1129794 RepID=K7AXS3_9ALTE|nr:carboxylating nicotinate-nucleotide diphosphorylase [Paraglaciecola psychrophila]AGH43566.1 nicotinate-nucleotide pyrophosphorylase [Paraglaciecola psychrophila 170]GAC39915.1 nicotinate-nucleotide pyrophosphorylase [Paraglaciecola psychrophila 170]
MQNIDIKSAVEIALSEDLNGLDADIGDITVNLIPATQTITADIITRENCVVAGAAWVTETFAQLDTDIQLNWYVKDGDALKANQPIVRVSGNARRILTGERTALNFLQTLSGTATIVAKCVKELAGTNTKLLDTRKTLPGMRLAQKYAVTCGGGKNHRIGLFDAYLIKENHILACGSIRAAVTIAREHHPDLSVEVEVENIQELHQAIAAKADIVMLDNFSLDMLKQAVLVNKGQCKLEVSGNITIESLKTLSALGVDFISSGALTKHVQAIDLSLRVITTSS